MIRCKALAIALVVALCALTGRCFGVDDVFQEPLQGDEIQTNSPRAMTRAEFAKFFWDLHPDLKARATAPEDEWWVRPEKWLRSVTLDGNIPFVSDPVRKSLFAYYYADNDIRIKKQITYIYDEAIGKYTEVSWRYLPSNDDYKPDDVASYDFIITTFWLILTEPKPQDFSNVSLTECAKEWSESLGIEPDGAWREEPLDSGLSRNDAFRLLVKLALKLQSPLAE